MIPRSLLHRATGALVLGLLGLPALAATQAVTARGGWFRYMLASIPAGGYVRLTNHGAAPAVLVGATSSGCGSIALHRTVQSGNTERMVAVPRIVLPAHGSLDIAPGGYHLMCMAPKMTLGRPVSVTFRFADGTTLTSRFAVRGAAATSAPMHGMHMP